MQCTASWIEVEVIMWRKVGIKKTYTEYVTHKEGSREYQCGKTIDPHLQK